jgi:hypothetical protein
MKPDQDETPKQWMLDAYKQKSQELLQLVERFMDLKRWSFQCSYINYSNMKLPPTVIYNSEWCRVKFYSNGWDLFGKESIGVYYGRVHASNEKWFIPWHGKNHLCWHSVVEALNFLDGLTPQEAVNLLPSGEWSRVINQFKVSEVGQRLLSVSDAEWTLGMQSFVWEHYGTRLFELFDLRHPDLWRQYENFIEAYHTINRTSYTRGYPMPDEIC